MKTLQPFAGFKKLKKNECKRNYMQITKDTHLEESTKNSGILFTIADVALFSEETTLSRGIKETDDLMIAELFERRLNLMRVNQDDLKLHGFRILSKARIGVDELRASWMVTVEYLRIRHLRAQNVTVLKNQVCLFHSRFTFWRVNKAWRARVC